METNQSIVDKINKDNELKFGPIKYCCNMFESYCRCTFVFKMEKKLDDKSALEYAMKNGLDLAKVAKDRGIKIIKPL